MYCQNCKFYFTTKSYFHKDDPQVITNKTHIVSKLVRFQGFYFCSSGCMEEFQHRERNYLNRISFKRS